MSSMHVKKGDTVKILSGKDKGKTGEVLRSIPQRQRVVVEKCNMVKKAMRPTQQNPQGGITTMEAPPYFQTRERSWQEGPRLQERRKRYRQINVD